MPKKSKKSSKQDELIYKNKIKGNGQGERLKEKATQYRLFENNDTFQTALKLGREMRVFERVGRESQTDV